MKNIFFMLLLSLFVLGSACSSSDETSSTESNGTMDTCISDQSIDQTRGACNETLAFASEYTENSFGSNRIISSNSIPNHLVGLFGSGSGALNPNAISPQNLAYSISASPVETGFLTPLLDDGPAYSFGVLFNGVEVDPIAAEPFPHNGIMDPNVNWEWNLEAMNVRIGLDCNNAHVQPTGKYHYHSAPTLFLEGLDIDETTMTQIGYAADGFPIYYKYAYSDPNDSSSEVIEMTSSYQLKSGTRPGDGITAPCGAYDGVYSNDYEYLETLGHLDEANGRFGATPEYPSGIYYYIVTDDFPSIPRFFKGTPSDDFKIGG